jgi:hypothetical protein
VSLALFKTTCQVLPYLYWLKTVRSGQLCLWSPCQILRVSLVNRHQSLYKCFHSGHDVTLNPLHPDMMFLYIRTRCYFTSGHDVTLHPLRPDMLLYILYTRTWCYFTSGHDVNLHPNTVLLYNLYIRTWCYFTSFTHFFRIFSLVSRPYNFKS